MKIHMYSGNEVFEKFYTISELTYIHKQTGTTIPLYPNYAIAYFGKVNLSVYGSTGTVLDYKINNNQNET